MVKQKHSSGFSLMELMVVMVILALLVSIVPPMVNNSIQKAKEGALKKDLAVMRKAIDDYYTDNGQYPAELTELVVKHYIRSVPDDPVADEDSPWDLDLNDDHEIVDIHSSSAQEARDGTQYSEW